MNLFHHIELSDILDDNKKKIILKRTRSKRIKQLVRIFKEGLRVTIELSVK